MNEEYLKNVNKIYFVGIGGIGMSAAAGIAKQLGYRVAGSDQAVYSPSLEVLRENDITVLTPYSEDNVKNNSAELYVVTAGVKLNNPEIKYIEEQDGTVCSFPELLMELAKDKIRIVVTGTHGKSTTTGILGHILSKIDDSSFLVGGVFQNEDTNFHTGDGHYFVFEGDEYKAAYNDPTPKFHYYKPDILLLTNLEFDHPDAFATYDELEREFELLISNLPNDGLIVYNADDVNLEKLIYQTNRLAFSFGINSGTNLKLVSSKILSTGTEFTVRVHFNDKDSTEVYKTQLFGEMNILNAMAAITLLRVMGFSAEQVSHYIKDFPGMKRRFEVVGEKSGITVIDDYAHHPTAVRETLAAAKLRYPENKIWAVLEPHTFSRTESLKQELAESFTLADEVILAPVYAARETATDASISSEKIAELIPNKSVKVVKSKEDALAILKAGVKSSDVVIVMAVGNFNQLAYELLEKLQ